jgi:hypothetical protein
MASREAAITHTYTSPACRLVRGKQGKAGQTEMTPKERHESKRRRDAPPLGSSPSELLSCPAFPLLSLQPQASSRCECYRVLMLVGALASLRIADSKAA